MVVSDTRFELCFDLFVGTSSITSNLEPCCAEQKMLVGSHRLLNQCLYNSIESSKESTNMQVKMHRFECCNVVWCLISGKPAKPQKSLSLTAFM